MRRIAEICLLLMLGGCIPTPSGGSSDAMNGPDRSLPEDARVADTAIGPDDGVTPDAGVAPDAHTEPDGDIAGDARVELDQGVEPDRGIAPDARVEPDGGAEPDVGCQPRAETCDGADQDCDGIIDEGTGGAACQTGELGLCNLGVEVCTQGEQVCERRVDPRAEVCDGRDDDCDGVVDDVEGLGDRCRVGIGACAADGVVVCTAGGPACDARPAAPRPEVCGDGLDNDCSGAIDDDPRCDAEICDNGIDDDADGTADCDDPDCAQVPHCAPLDELCARTGDEDGNGLADCLDPTCLEHPVCTTTPIAEPGGRLRMSGAIDAGDATWARPTARCAIDDADQHPYEALRIVNRTGAPRDLQIEAVYAGGADGDGYLHVFREPFDGARLDTCVVGDDDGERVTANSRIDAQPIAAGEVLVLVVSTYSGDDSANNRFIGDFEVIVDTRPGALEDCAIAGDEDGDGRADCADPDCLDEPACRVDEDCAVVGDEDRNGLADCEDRACADAPECLEDCALLGDEDGNGRADCADPACVDEPQCAPEEDCGLPADEDGNGLADCEDPACFEDRLCLAPAPIARPGEAVELAGALDEGDRTFRRPGADCQYAADPLFEDRHPYESFRLVNQTASIQHLDVRARFADGPGYLHIWRDPFSTVTLDDCLIGDENVVGPADSLIERVEIWPGEVLVVVVSSRFGDDSDFDRFIGEYAVTVTTRQPPVTPIPAPGDEVLLIGSIDDDDSTWARPESDCRPSPDDQHPFDTFIIANDSGLDQTIDLHVDFGGGIDGDGFMHVFADSFDPDDLATCIIGDDDGPLGSADSELLGQPIAAGQQLWVVISTHYGDRNRDGIEDLNLSIGEYWLRVTTQP